MSKRENGSILILMLVALFIVGGLGIYLFMQGSQESGQLKRAVKFAAQEETESLIMLDKAAHTWLGKVHKNNANYKNYEAIIESDVRYEILIEDLIAEGLLPGDFADRFNDVGESVYGLPYTSSVIKREVSNGTKKTCVHPDDKAADCTLKGGGSCRQIDLIYGNCERDDTDDMFSVLTTIDTKGSPIPPPPEMTCPFYSEYDDGRGFFFAVNAPGFDTFELEGSCHDYYNAATVRTQARDYLLDAVNVQKTAVLKDAYSTYSYIDVASYGNVTVKLECSLISNPANSDYISVSNYFSPKTMDSFVFCDITRTAGPASCDVNINYCANDVYEYHTRTISVGCSGAEVTAIENSLNTGGFAYRPYSNYPVDNPWACSALGNNINCSGSSNCGTPPGPTSCPAFLNYTKDSNLVEDKSRFATYPGACSSYVTVAETDVVGAFASKNYLWTTGPTCTPAINGVGEGELWCTGSEGSGGGGGNEFCDVYLYDGRGEEHKDYFGGTDCNGNVP